MQILNSGGSPTKLNNGEKGGELDLRKEKKVEFMTLFIYEIIKTKHYFGDIIYFKLQYFDNAIIKLK